MSMDGEQGRLTLSSATPDEAAGAVGIVLPEDPAMRRLAAERRGGMRWWAIALTAACYAAILLSLFLGPYGVFRGRPPVAPPEAIPVTLVMAPPPPPAPATKPPPPPPAYRESGKDTQTTAPPPADVQANEAKAPDPAVPAPEPSPSKEPPAAVPPAPSEAAAPAAPNPKKSQHAAVRPPAEKKDDVARAPHPTPQRPIEIVPSDKQQSGDPYLNTLLVHLERHRSYPELARLSGLQGLPVYVMILDRSGNLYGIKLLQSSGALILDQAGARIIREAAPFPPPPPNFYPGDLLPITVRLPISPPSE